MDPSAWSLQPNCHPSLLVPEILLEILSHLVPRHRGSLAAAAATCKFWVETALDILWRDGVDLIHLLHILSPTNTKKSGEVVRTLERPICLS